MHYMMHTYIITIHHNANHNLADSNHDNALLMQIITLLMIMTMMMQPC